MSFINFIDSADQAIYFMDMLGVIACAFAGTLLAKHKGLDVFGCIIVAMINAIGGGTVRDLLLDRHPLFWMTDLTYLWVITFVSLAVQVCFQFAHRVDKMIKRFDAIGLAVFVLIGLKVGLAHGAVPQVAILMGIITATFGGLVRDIICNEIPFVLRQEIYITAGVIGACVYFALLETSLNTWVVDFTTVFVIYIIRMMAVHLDLHLPNISIKHTDK